MALKVGDQAPEISLNGTAGPFTLSTNLVGKSCVVYFYPKDFTAGCTKEACAFRDQFELFLEVDIKVIGISRDSVKTHREFKAKNNLPFELLSDTSGDVSKAYKAIIPVIGMNKRITYLLDEDHKIKAVFENMFNIRGHIESVLSKLK